jgi:hypothetical protein
MTIKKRQEPNITSFIDDYKRGLNDFLNHTQFGTEKEFKEMEIEIAIKEIESRKEKIKWIMANKAIRKIGDKENSLENINYHSIWLSHYTAYMDWLKKKKPDYNTLFEAFKDTNLYQRIMNILVSKQLCNSGNYHWKDSKEKLIDLLKFLDTQGYLNRKLTQKEMEMISKNTFGIDKISNSSMRPKPGKIDFPFIPLSSTLS